MAEPIAAVPPRAGRPPKVDENGVPTRQRLIDAAVAACVEHGYDGATLSDIAKRAGVSTPAAYGYFSGKSELMLIAGSDAFERITTYPEAANGATIVRAWLSSETADERRMLLELHRAAGRHRELRKLIDEWAHDQAESLYALGIDLAHTKLIFLVMFGLLHLDDIDTLDANHEELVASAISLLNGLAGFSPS